MSVQRLDARHSRLGLAVTLLAGLLAAATLVQAVGEESGKDADLETAIDAILQARSEPTAQPLTLSDAAASEPTTQSAATPLGEPRARALLDQLPPLAEEAPLAEPPPLPSAGASPPSAARTMEPIAIPPEERPGAFPTVVGPLPPPPTPTPAPTPAPSPTPPAELSVIVFPYSPKEPTRDNQITITFSEPMVAVPTSDVREVPVRLAPATEGSWRWVNQRSLVFDPKISLIPSSEYDVEVQAGVTSLRGLSLAKAIHSNFRTDAARIVARWPEPGSVVSVQPVVLMLFSHAVNPQDILGRTHAEEDGSAVSLRLATEREAVPPGNWAPLPEGRWVAVVPERPLKAHTRFTVEPCCAEKQGERWTYATASDRVGLAAFGCEVPGEGCPPELPWRLDFTESVDVRDLTKRIRIVPPVPALEIRGDQGSWWPWGRALRIYGAFRPRTDYRLLLKGGIGDAFNPQAGADLTLAMRTRGATPNVWAPEGMHILDPRLGTSLALASVNLPAVTVTLRAVRPEDWPAYQAAQDTCPDAGAGGHVAARGRPSFPGLLVRRLRLQPHGALDQLVESRIDLAPALTNGLGHVLVIVEADIAQPHRQPWECREAQPSPIVAAAWIQVTGLALDFFPAGRQAWARVTRLGGGRPVRGARVLALGGQTSTLSNGAGFARISLSGAGACPVVVARRGVDSLLLQASCPDPRAGSYDDGDRWFSFDGRGLFRPGEKVTVKGWLRQVEWAEASRLAPMPGAEVSYDVHDAGGKALATGTTRMNRFGGFDLDFDLPKDTSSGAARIDLALAGTPASRHSHAFQVQEYRPPEFEIATQAPSGPLYAEEDTQIGLVARYLNGGALRGASVTWSATTERRVYSPPGWDGYEFGDEGNDCTTYKEPCWCEVPEVLHEGRTAADGRHALRLRTSALARPRPIQVDLVAWVTDANHKSSSERVTVFVHPAEVYVGLKLETTSPKAGAAVLGCGHRHDHRWPAGAGACCGGTTRPTRTDVSGRVAGRARDLYVRRGDPGPLRADGRHSGCRWPPERGH